MRSAILLLAIVIACVEPPADADAPARGGDDEGPPSLGSPDVEQPSAGQTAGSRGDPAAAPATGSAATTPLPIHDPDQAAPDQEQATTLIDRYDLSRRTARFDLPGRLDEISGLSFSPDGRLFGHDDERGRVFELDPVTGEVGKRWDLGEDLARDDFEGIAIAGDRFFLVSSRGLLYEFREGIDGEDVPYRVTDTGLGANCEVEGLEYDVRDDALLFACKVSTPGRRTVTVHRIPLDPTRPRLEPLLIAKAQLRAIGLGEEFDPSGIALDPSGSLVLVSGRHEAIIEVDRTGRPLSGYRLSKDRHPQPEGVAFGPDATLYLSDERNGRDARLTAYARIDPGESPSR